MAKPQPPDVPIDTSSQEAYAKLTYNASLGLCFACPAIMLLPPRKLDLYTLGLGTIWFMSLNHQTQRRTGRTIYQMVSGSNKVVGSGIPQSYAIPESLPTVAAREREQLLKEHKERELAERKESWKEKRLREEQEAINDGRGYGGMIADQIWEVWNQGKKKDDDDE